MTLSIGDLSRRAGVKIPTIRYYEQIGLLANAERTVGRQRRYTDDDVTALLFVRQARALGFEVDAIRELLQLDEAARPDKAAIAARHLEAVEKRIRALEALGRELSKLKPDGPGEASRIVQVLAEAAASDVGDPSDANAI